MTLFACTVKTVLDTFSVKVQGMGVTFLRLTIPVCSELASDNSVTTGKNSVAFLMELFKFAFISIRCEFYLTIIFFSSANNGVFVKCKQLREKPINIPDPHSEYSYCGFFQTWKDKKK